MNDNFLNLLKQLNLQEKTDIYNGDLVEILIDPTTDSWLFDVEFDEPISISDFEAFHLQIQELPKEIKSCKKAELTIRYKNNDFKRLEDYYDFVLKRLAVNKPRFSAIVDFDIEINKNRIEVICPSDGTFVTAMLYEIKSELLKMGFDALLATRICKKQPKIKDRIIKEGVDFENTVNQQQEFEVVEKRYVSFNNNAVRGIKHTIADVPKTENDLIEYKSMSENTIFTLEGEITKVDYRALNTGTHLYTFILSNDVDSIYLKKFVKDKDEKKFMDGTKVGMLAKIKGNASFDKFSDEVTVTAIVFERTNYIIPKDPRKDLATEKRVELHLHTKMSTLDGIDNITDFVNTAKKWGHEAIALTDHGNVQSFPELYKATKDKSIKPIYGCEFTFVDERDLQIVQNPIDIAFTDATYVVFDIETTGLSVNYDKIIEISAIKVKNNQVIDQYDTFVNPERPISLLTTRLTSIKNSDVALAPKIEEVIPEFKKFFEGSIMVAHNAHFDMGFIYSVLKQNDLYDKEITTIDTLQIARSLYSNQLKRFNLKAVSKFFKVNLEQHHRAEYDTRATQEIFLHMLRDARHQGITNIKDFNMLSDKSDAYKHSISKHINILVKNQQGLRNLYKIVSDANTTHFHREARLLRSVLDENREGLLVGSGCMNSKLFEIAKNKSYEELKEYAKYYDYLEVQPIRDFAHLEQDMDNFKVNIQDTITRIIKVGKELNIPVIATGDVHHIREMDKKYREIYVVTPLVGGGLHPLSRYKNIPSQYFRTTNEMLEEFFFVDEETRTEIVITNSQLINSKIEFVKAFIPELYAPKDDFLALEGIPSVQNKLIKMVNDKARGLYGDTLPKIVEDRINKEVKSITENKFSTVYYISHLLVKKSLDEGYLVGSRGSVGSSLVATLMDITEVNPLPPHYVCPKCKFSSFKMTTEEKGKYSFEENEIRLQAILDKYQTGYDLPNETCPVCSEDLKKDGHSIPFETFLGFKGDKVPDIDLNFSGDYQPAVHEYIRKIFGHERAFRAGTISTVAEKTAFGYVKGFLEKKDLTMRKAEIERNASHITGTKRSTGQHPGGIVVVPSYKEIIDVTPIQFPADDTTGNWRTTHFDYHSFEDNLFKLDVLGHDDPTMIRFLMDYVKEHPIDFPFSDATEIPLDDPKVYSLLSTTQSIGLSPDELGLDSEVASFGVPEMGTRFVRDMLKDSRPNTFADIVKISGLSHGTDVWLNNAKDLVTNRTSFGKIAFKDVIGCRDDIMVSLIAWGMEEATAFEISEFIRKGKAAGNPDKWEGYKLIMRDHKIPNWYIWSCGKIKYMFPKAHATAYVIMALRIAWFKYYHPIVFYSAYFSKRASDFDVYALKGGEYEIYKKYREIMDKGNAASETEKRTAVVLEVAYEMVKRGFKFKNINLHKSEARDFVIDEDNKSLIIPFITIDGLGLKVAESVVTARTEREFKSKDDIKERTSLSKTLFNKLDMLDVFEGMPDNSQMNLFNLS
ncbi:DNA polymerase III PolC-type [Candidatus Izimaplasma bacterium HR1]|jgi:DNA polymerase-3 subunit alpha (Gram-positive type)|uniref:PolC-type DNA polymerase III n=1 Tax=Candidatus Izimoplasma sp. HR1 TaxID=1541959 RepID=UPI0004F7D314|nr:DNA polymerase III PolC-type [Candidatus Izimaplasma bacterium HR1]